MKQSPPSTHLTHATGTPVTDNLNIQTAGPRGPGVAQAIARLGSGISEGSRRIA